MRGPIDERNKIIETALLNSFDDLYEEKLSANQ